MQKNKIFSLVGILSMALVLAFVGCKSSDDDPKDTPNPPPAAEEQLTGYNGGVKEVIGYMNWNDPKNIGKIGSITTEGKLTLNLPASIPDDKLFDADNGIKRGILSTTPDLILAKSQTDYLSLVYCNKAGTIEGIAVKQGWNYANNTGTVTDTTGYKWMLKE